MTSKTAIVILAAGASSRMGVPKQLLPWGSSTLIGHVIKISSSLNTEVHVILGANAHVIQSELPMAENINIYLNPEWKGGIGNSIAFAVKTLKKHHLDGILFLLGDQPFVTKDYLEKMRNHFDKNTTSIIASEFNGSLGVPALFPSEYFDELSTLNGDVGAKKIVLKYSDKLIKLAANDYVTDIDTISDYKTAHDLHFGKRSQKS